jgi:3-deoxy-D-manno-octulosonic-acid transferase
METELWPNLVAAARARGVPILLVNARLSERSARRYARAPRATRALLQSLAGIAAQTDADAARLRALGARDPATLGNLKFDVTVPAQAAQAAAAMRERLGRSRPVLLGASTREGEEALLLDAWASARTALPPGTLLVLVPRHPQRFDAVARLLDERRVAHVRRTDEKDVPPSTEVVLGDSMGELMTYYGAADLAFVGGSLLPLGGQNLLESLAAGTPALVGPHTFNFAAATDEAVASGAALRVQDADDVMREAARLLSDADARERMRVAGAAMLAAHRGATDRLWAWLAPRLSPRAPTAAPGAE